MVYGGLTPVRLQVWVWVQARMRESLGGGEVIGLVYRDWRGGCRGIEEKGF